ncbi:ankyrin repeat domain-containing protein 53 [Notolabrus celidotus]|uniref:ankyrin repeat domain-containing protein 53 n=1 Tax=Notolabrus celidotus TaxID=1203425 RepID=UPI00149046AC|nr:ankyrin repeat domain-containing protein 53 [Notolabrus celidotus]
MATMEPVNKSGKRRRGGCKNRKLTLRAPSSHELALPGVPVTSPEKLNVLVSLQGPSALHMACLHGQLATIQILLDSRPGMINGGDQQGRRPVHMVLSSRSSPNTSSCIRYLLEHGADINVTTESGATPLHLAASEGLLECAEIFVQAGADVSAKDSMGLTPLDFARVWCRRKVARYLRSCMWQKDKDKEQKERKSVQALYRDLIDGERLDRFKNKIINADKIAEWANKKGLPPLKDFTPRVQVSKFHTKCLSSDQDTSNQTTTKDPLENQSNSASSSSFRPWTIYLGFHPERPLKVEPDLRSSVTVWRDSSRSPLYSTKWDSSTPHPAPDLPLDVLERVLFPRAFPSRIASLQHFKAQDIMEVQHRGYPQGRSTSPWTEGAMHLVEVLELGHY